MLLSLNPFTSLTKNMSHEAVIISLLTETDNLTLKQIHKHGLFSISQEELAGVMRNLREKHPDGVIKTGLSYKLSKEFREYRKLPIRAKKTLPAIMPTYQDKKEPSKITQPTVRKNIRKRIVGSKSKTKAYTGLSPSIDYEKIRRFITFGLLGNLSRNTNIGQVAYVLYAYHPTPLSVEEICIRSNIKTKKESSVDTALKRLIEYDYAVFQKLDGENTYRWSGVYQYPFDEKLDTDPEMLLGSSEELLDKLKKDLPLTTMFHKLSDDEKRITNRHLIALRTLTDRLLRNASQ